MRKYSWLIALFAILALAFVGFVSCDGDGDDTPPEDQVPEGFPFTPGVDDFPGIEEILAFFEIEPGKGGAAGALGTGANIYNAGAFNAALGNVFAISWWIHEGYSEWDNDTSSNVEKVPANDKIWGIAEITNISTKLQAIVGTATHSNSEWQAGINVGGWVAVFFEKTIDVSTFTEVLFNSSDEDEWNWWHGGIVFVENPASRSDVFSAGYYDGDGAGENGHTLPVAIPFADLDDLEDKDEEKVGDGSLQPTKVVGFAVKSTGTIDVTRIFLE